jgi:hypothetical protein
VSAFNNASPDAGLSLGEVEAALRRLARKGVKIRWIYQSVGDTLLYLRCVDGAVPANDPDRDASAKRLIEVLREVVGSIKRADYRLLLEVVYALDPTYLSWSAEARRDFLTTNLYPDDEPLKPDTIRRNHQPSAIRLLAKLLVDYDATYAGNGDSANSDIHLPGQRAAVSGRYVTCDELGTALEREATVRAGEVFPSVRSDTREYGWKAA